MDDTTDRSNDVREAGSSVPESVQVWGTPDGEYCHRIPTKDCGRFADCELLEFTPKAKRSGWFFGKKQVKPAYKICVNKNKHNQADYDRFFGVGDVSTLGRLPDWSFDWRFEKPLNSTIMMPEVVMNRVAS